MTDAMSSESGTAGTLDSSKARSSAHGPVGWLRRAGTTRIDAARLAGLAVGFGPVASGWSVLEAEWLRFQQEPDANGELRA
ncbi:MAG TPA: hypothetical protein VFX65_09960 [Candidatus Limnocylindrales bacterium]|nr:hypothetical protein [Candidatus Limnocylindrales bacterium]